MSGNSLWMRVVATVLIVALAFMTTGVFNAPNWLAVLMAGAVLLVVIVVLPRIGRRRRPRVTEHREHPYDDAA